jgi:hypothetical protein
MVDVLLITHCGSVSYAVDSCCLPPQRRITVTVSPTASCLSDFNPTGSRGVFYAFLLVVGSLKS